MLLKGHSHIQSIFCTASPKRKRDTVFSSSRKKAKRAHFYVFKGHIFNALHMLMNFPSAIIKMLQLDGKK